MSGVLTTGTFSNGINQAPLIGAAHRIVTWNGQAPPGTAGLTVSMFHDPHNRFPFLEQVGKDLGVALADIGRAIDDAAGALDQFCKNTQPLCTVLFIALIVTVAIFTGGEIKVEGGGVDVVWHQDVNS